LAQVAQQQNPQLGACPQEIINAKALLDRYASEARDELNRIMSEASHRHAVALQTQRYQLNQEGDVQLNQKLEQARISVETRLQAEMQRYSSQREEINRQQQSQGSGAQSTDGDESQCSKHELTRLSEQLRNSIDDGQQGRAIGEDFKTRVLEAEDRTILLVHRAESLMQRAESCGQMRNSTTR
jgi:hypothetical protein